jgi:hypothetical protein
MNRTPSFVSFLVAALVALAVSVISCGDSLDSVDASAPKSSSTQVPEKTAERLVERSMERWKLIVAAQEDETKWIEIYGYELPEVRRHETLGVYLEGKHKFHYDAPTMPRVLLIDGELGYVQVDCTWLAFMHPVIAQNSPGRQDLMEMLEIWHWSEGDWYFEAPPRERQEYFRENPELLDKMDAYLAVPSSAQGESAK